MSIMRLIIWILSSSLVVSVAWAEAGKEQVLLSSGGITVTEQDVQQALLLLTQEQRNQALAGSEQIRELLRRIYQDKNMVATAEKQGLDQAPLVQARLVAERRRVLAQALRDYTKEQIGQPDFTALAREHYLIRRDDMQLPDQFKAAHIMKKVHCGCEDDEKKRLMEQLLMRIRAGEDFATLAKAESEDTWSAPQGGDLGRWLQRKELGDSFTDALLKLENGQISEVVKTPSGFHIIKRLDFLPAHLPSFEEAQPKIEKHLREHYIQDQLMQRAAEYFPPQDAKFDDKALEVLLRKNMNEK
jgi:parvulin-like peptidyl-prolyl isomerase